MHLGDPQIPVISPTRHCGGVTNIMRAPARLCGGVTSIKAPTPPPRGVAVRRTSITITNLLRLTMSRLLLPHGRFKLCVRHVNICNTCNTDSRAELKVRDFTYFSEYIPGTYALLNIHGLVYLKACFLTLNS